MAVSYDPICSVAEIEAYFKTKFSSDTRPSNTEITTWVLNATALIYGAIKSTYVVPVTNDDDLAILKEICEAYVRDKVNYTQGANIYTVPQAGVNVPRTIKFNSFKEAIAMLQDGTIILGNTSSSAIVATRDYNYTNGITAQAKKGVDQW